MTELVKLLRDEPFFWSRLGFCYDPPRAGTDGRQILFSREFESYNRIHRQFSEAGVKFHTTILHSGWTADKTYDYTLTDETLDALFDGNPDIFYMPRVKLNVPPDWCRNHPEDTFVYWYGPRKSEEIAALAQTDKHDYFGFDSDGYAVNGGKGTWKDDRVNRGGLIGLQSFSSRQWVADASETLKRLLEHLAASKYADRIIGVHIAYGMCGETNLWGSWSPFGEGRRGDFGITNRRRFAEYGTEKYGNIEAALEKWGDLEPPAPLRREGVCDHLHEMFFEDGTKERDYFDFVSSTNADAIEAYCKIVKDAGSLFGRELAAGVFYGYMYLPQAANIGHLAIRRLIDSPYVDFMSSPKGYYRCLAGDPGGEQGPSESIALEKAWLDEIDNHTHLDRRANGERAADMFESKTLLWRESIKNLTHGQGFWWMDLGEGWYDDPELMTEIKCITDLGRRIRSIPRKSTAEILLVVDDVSIASSRVSYGLNSGLMYKLHSELKLCGAPVDTLLKSDIYRIPLGQYKLVVFANCFKLGEGEREKLLSLLKGKFVVWNYAAGILSPNYDPENFKLLTGYGLREVDRSTFDDDAVFGYYGKGGLKCDFPLFTVEREDAEVLERYPNGDPMCALSNNICVSACPSLCAADFRSLAKRAGVNILCDADCTVYADNRIAGFYPKYDFDGEISVNGKRVPIKIPARGRKIFELI